MTTSTVGERIAAYRRQRGMSQRELATEMRRSESWVSQVERGVQPVERLSVLQALAAVLGVTVRDLRPEAMPDGAADEPAINDLDGVRMGLSGHPALPELFATQRRLYSPSEWGDVVGELTADVERVWELAHADRFADLSAALTDVLPKIETTVRWADDHNDGRPLHALRARAYQAVAAAFARQDEADAAWVAADRAIAAAELAGDALEVVAGHFRLAHAFIRLRRLDQADRVTTSALEVLRPIAEKRDVSERVLSLYGAMHLVRAIASAHEGNRATARAHLDEAAAVADRLGEDRNDFDTEFGPTNVQLHRVAVAVDLGDAGEALDVAAEVDAGHLSPERRARFLVDVARAHAQRRHLGEATAALVEAEQLAPEHVRAHHQSRATIEDLLAQAGRRPPTNLSELARRVGLAP